MTTCHRSCAAWMNLNATPSPAARDPGPRVIFVRCRTVANVLWMGFVVRKPGCTSPLIDMARAWWAGCRVGVGHERVAGRPAPPRSFGVPRQERRSGGLELGDRLLDHGVATVIGLDLQQITNPVVTMAAAFLYRGLGLVASGCLKRGAGVCFGEWRVCRARPCRPARRPACRRAMDGVRAGQGRVRGRVAVHGAWNDGLLLE